MSRKPPIEAIHDYVEFLGEMGYESVLMRKKTESDKGKGKVVPIQPYIKSQPSAEEDPRQPSRLPRMDAPEIPGMASAPSTAAELIPAGEGLDDIRSDIGDCRRCKLHLQRKNIVFGSGNPNARVMFVGEGPGADEDEQGIPFVGKAGQLLTKIIEAIRFSREEVYIANVVKCRPPNNRTPEPDEIAICQAFLFRQIAVIQPWIICALGAPSTHTLLQIKTPISQLRGKWHNCRGSLLMPTFHPSYLLRNPSAKREVWEDVKQLRARYDTLCLEKGQ